MASLLLKNAAIASFVGHQPYGLIEGGAVLLEDGHIRWVGETAQSPAADQAYDLQGRLVTPGLIDCHTHIIYGGSRAHEFEMRLNGASYVDIANAGGGILSTVKATRAASEEELVAQALPRLDALLSEGVTTLEVKSGYGLETKSEISMLKAARKLGAARPVDIITTFLGAHALPPEYKTDRAAYLKLVCEEMLPQMVGLADAVDAFCEGIAFSVEETAQVFTAARKLGLPVKLHAEQLTNLGGSRMAAGFGALSVDHVEYLDQNGIDSIAKSGTVAVLLPGAFYYLRERQAPPVAGLRKANVPMAVATDLNPGTSPVHSLLTAMNMACVLFGLTPEEALRGTTLNAARALGLKDRGQIAPGLKADLAIWNTDRPGNLSYPLGFNPCAAVIRNGALVRGSFT
ncbi:MAG: imidazolonepropionase [Aestuariivirgaceae bacterium]|nr:imidazolonepropionase [Aestuariivirgaceae bacterium]